MRRSAAAAGLAALLALPACGGCGTGAKAPPPERFVTASAALAVVLPDLARLAGDARAVLETARTFPAAAALVQWRDAARSQLGFDPLDPGALARAGVDPARGAAVAWIAGTGAAPSAAVLVLPVGDRGDLEDLVARLARDRAGATERAAERVGDADVTVWRAPGGAPAVALAFRERTALVSAGPGGPEAVAAAASGATSASLAEAAEYRALRAAAGEVVAFGFRPAAGGGRWRGAVGAGFSGDAGRVRIVAVASPRADGWSPTGGGAAALARRLDPAATLVGVWHGAPADFGREAVALAPDRDRAWLAARGLDLRRDVFDLLGPGVAGSAALSPRASVAALSPEVLRTDPLRLVRFEVVAPLRDVPRALETSARLARLADPRLPARPAPAAPGRPARFRIALPSGEIAWAVDRERARVAVAGGEPGRLDALLARLEAGDGFQPPTDAAARALDGGLGGLVLEPERLAESVRALPAAAFGEGPDAFVARSVAERIVAPAARIAAVSLRVEAVPGADRTTVEIEVRPEGAR